MALTTNDLRLIKDIVKITIDEELDVKLEEKFNEKLGALPNKEEFYQQTDKIMKELKDIREEHTILTNKVYDNHETRMEKIEKKLNLQPAI